MDTLRKASELKERLSGPPSRRAAYYTLAQASYVCLAGSFEMPMAFRLAGRIDLVAFVYAFFYLTLFGGFALGMILVREGRASSVYRASLGLWAALSLGAAAFFPCLKGILALVVYFLFRGLAEGMYWAARHRAFLWSVRDAGRDRFALRLQSIVVSLSVALPLLGGFAITYLGPSAGGGNANGSLPAGYVPVFLLTGCVMLLALALSPRLEIGRSPLSFRSALGVFKLAPAASWRAYLCFTGFAGGLVGISAGVQTFGVLKTEFRIGALSAGVAFLSGLLFFALGKLLAGKRGVRTGGVLVGAVADSCSRTVYSLAPDTGGLAVKAVLDALAVPLKSLLGENVQFALIERLSREGKVSVAELYLFREFLLWVARLCACATTALALFLVSGLPDAPRTAGRLLLAAAAPIALVEYLFVRSFARANAAAAAARPADSTASAAARRSPGH
jgi:hypothetical protein